jgi:NAD(P)-dependent dehydrogenase (short-subunit alcohol dehydrogenase family)
MSAMNLAGRVALVTGSGRGIGRASALRLAALGADVVISDIDLDSAAAVHELRTAATVIDEVHALGRRSIGIEVDVTKEGGADDMIREVIDTFGRLDILVNNVGGGQAAGGGHLKGGSDQVSSEQFQRALDFNLISTIYCCKAAMPHMIAGHWGRIVNMTSLHGLMVRSQDDLSFAARTTYGIAKAGLIQYTRVLAAELGPHGIRVNCIAPAAIVTGRVHQFGAKGEMIVGDRLRECPLGRAGEADDVAKVVEFLCTDLSDYVTGQCIRVDGGRTLF